VRARRVVIAMDKFRSTAEVADLNRVASRAFAATDDVDVVATSDGGEGFRGAFGGTTLRVRVRGPWGEAHEAPVTRLRVRDETVGVLEVAEIIGRSHRVVPTSHEALVASSAGVGDALVAVGALGVDRVVVGCGGSATSDGGEGCYEVLHSAGSVVAMTAATDITATFMGALRYAEQKGVDAHDLGGLERRLRALGARYERECGRDVMNVARTGAAGGLVGALYARGATLVSGFDEVARVSQLAERIASARLVVTGEGRLDAGSLEGKVVAGVCALTDSSQRVLVVCGARDEDVARSLQERYPWVRVVDLVTRFGESRARHDTVECVARVVADFAAS
jgi:glycerate 2-kinase